MQNLNGDRKALKKLKLNYGRCDSVRIYKFGEIC